MQPSIAPVNAGWRGMEVQRWLMAKPAIMLYMVLLGILGYRLAPPDLLPGDYVANINVTIAGQIYEVQHPFHLVSQPGAVATETRVQEIPAGEYTLRVSGPSAIPFRLGQRITYKLQVLTSSGQLVEGLAVTSKLVGPSYVQELPPGSQDATGYSFAMRVPYKAKIASALLLAMPLLWLSEVAPLAAGALLVGIVAVLAGVAEESTVFQPFSHPIIALFLAGFLLAEAMRRTGVDRRIALFILQKSSLRPAYLMMTMMAITAFLSMWMSNTAAVAIMIPIALTVQSRLPAGYAPEGYRRALVLGLAYAGTVGGIGSAIGTPANILAMTFLNDVAGTQLRFVDWFAFGLPVVAGLLPLIWLYLLLSYGILPWRQGPPADRSLYIAEWQQLGKPTLEQAAIFAIFGVIMLLWLTEEWHHLPTATVALSGAFMLFIVGVIKQEDLSRINWNALLTFGGGLALGTLLVSTGYSDWLALRLLVLGVLPKWVIVLLVGMLTLVIGAVMSNTSAAAMLIPLAIPLGQMLGVDPVLLVGVVAVASSIDFAMVIGTPPTMMAYSTGLYTTREIFRRGIMLDLLAMLWLGFGVIAIWRWLGIVQF
jgi:solute carrier family 13 (sodium-dependent dicarboxylate transporter), member 2/3/5